MREEVPQRHIKRQAGEGLEFVGASRRPLFKQYTDRFQQYTGQVKDVGFALSNNQITASQNLVPQAKPNTSPQVAQNEDAAYQSSALNYGAQGYTPKQNITTPPAKAQPFVTQPISIDESAFAEPIAAELETIATQEQENEDDLPIVKLKHPNKETDKQNRRSKFKLAATAVTVILCLAVLAVSVKFILSNQPVITASIKKQAGFPLYAPVSNSLYKVDKKSVKKGDNDSIVYDIYAIKGADHFIVSQQKLPDIVKDDAQYLQFLSQIDKFADFNTQIGKAYLTKPANTGNDVTIVVKTATTLLFIRSAGTTTEEQWGALLSYMKVAK